jgi:hypothetical protein
MNGKVKKRLIIGGSISIPIAILLPFLFKLVAAAMNVGSMKTELMTVKHTVNDNHTPRIATIEKAQERFSVRQEVMLETLTEIKADVKAIRRNNGP